MKLWSSTRMIRGSTSRLLPRLSSRRKSFHSPPDVPKATRSQPRQQASRSGNTAAAWHMHSALTRFDRCYEVFEVSKSGKLSRTSVTLGEVLRNFEVNPRDVSSLGIQDERYNPPPTVLPRDGVIMIALGSFKALLHTEACLLFEADKVDVSHIAPILAELMQANAQEPVSMSNEGDSNGGDVNGNDGCKLEHEGLLHQDISGNTAAAASAAASLRTSPASTKSDMQGTRSRGQESNSVGGHETERAGIASRIGDYVGKLGFGKSGRIDGNHGDNEVDKEIDDIQEHQMKVMFREQRPMPFELAILEAMLHEVVESYYRRAHVVRRLMEQRLKPKEITSLFTPNRVEHYRVVPLKLALKQLELKLSQTRACLEELLHNDEDMLGLLLTETKELAEGELLDPIRHSVVELLLENYHRQLVLVEHDVAAMKQELESMQELAAISLDVSRNSMIEVDIRLGILNLGIASSACVFGAFGMNVVNGLESSNVAFFALLGGTAAACAAGMASVVRHFRSVTRSGDTQQGLLKALNTICEHVDDIEVVLRTELDWQSGRKTNTSGAGFGLIDRDAMATKLARARGKKVSNEELDLIFAAFDTTGDGAIDSKEYGKLVTESAASLNTQGGGNGVEYPRRGKSQQ